MLTLADHKEKDYIKYSNHEALSKIQSPRQELYAKVKAVLSEYYFYLKETKEIQSFEDLSVLKTLVCLISCWNRVRETWKSFLRSVSKVTNL